MEPDISQTMPLFSPVYAPEYLQSEKALLKAIRENTFNADTNQLAQQILYDDSGNYNAWYLKKKYLLTEGVSEELLTNQMQFVDTCLARKVKGFQVWQQRRFLTEQGYDWKPQLQKIETILLEKDQKNYHAWSLRVWLTQYAKIHSEELLFAEKMIEKDPYNNSAWNHLYFALQGALIKLHDSEDKKKLLSNYIGYVLESLKTHSYNRAAWNFLRGLFPSIKLKKTSSKNTQKQTLIKDYSQYPEVAKHCLEEWKKHSYYDKKDESIQVIQRQVLATMIHIYSQKEDTVHYCKNICDELKTRETQRAHYWAWIQNNL